jgi:hypothetical protein
MLNEYLFQTAKQYRRLPYVLRAESFVGTTDVGIELDKPARLSCTLQASSPTVLTVVGSTIESFSFTPTQSYRLGAKLFTSCESLTVEGSTASLIEVRAVDAAGNQVGVWKYLGEHKVRLARRAAREITGEEAPGEVWVGRYKLLFIINRDVEEGDVFKMGEKEYKVTSVDHLYTRVTYHHTECVVEESEGLI